MNQAILMAEVLQPAQTRYTPDQTAIAEATVTYPGLRPEDPSSTLKVVGWGNMAQEVQDRCQAGASLIFEGRLRISTVERPEGFKEKLVELSVSKIHSVGSSPALGHEPAQNHAPAQVNPDRQVSRKAPAMAATPEPDYNDIPF